MRCKGSLILFVLLAGCGGIVSPPPPGPPPGPAPTPAVGLARLRAGVAAQREKAGRPAWRWDAGLDGFAGDHARAMAGAGIIGHDDVGDGTFQSRAARAGLGTAGEAVALGGDADATVAMWMKSPPHRAILLGGYAEAGVGLARDSGGIPFWCLAAAGSAARGSR